MMVNLFLLVCLVIGGCLAGYDEFLSCDRMFDESARKARVLEAIPQNCDMARNGFCFEKGGYPDDAIKRFLNDNLGLMKRMASEMNPTEIQREMRSSSFSLYEKDNQEHIDDHYDERTVKTSSFNLIQEADSLFNGLQYDINGHLYKLKQGSGLAMVMNAKDETLSIQSRTSEEPVFQNVREASTIDTEEKEKNESHITTVTITSSSSSSSSSSSIQSTASSTTMSSTTTTVKPTSRQTETTIAPTTTSTEQPTTILFTDSSTETTVQEEIKEATTEPVAEYIEYEEATTESNEDNIEDYKSESEVLIEMSTDELTNLKEEITNLDPEDLESTLSEVSLNQAPENTMDVEDDEEVEELDEREELKKEEPKKVYDYTGDSINACDTEETIDAPYWANNTRNQMLALLNLYPFEQYIHMEICKAEHDEMLCHPGCRCEQQYRLHRLLAFDPNNECRGIFSDWFRFPSFCLCKCYKQAVQMKEIKMQKSLRSPKTKDFSTEQRQHRGPGPTHNSKNSYVKEVTDQRKAKDSKLFNHQMDGIPAIFPYEAKAAYFAEMQDLGPKLVLNPGIRDGKVMQPAGRGMTIPQNTEIEKEDPRDIIIGAISDEHMDNTVESDQVHAMKKQKQGRQLDENIFYSAPIVEFKLPDGTTGTIEQTPRK